MKTKIRTIKLREWFPADDEVATCIDRLCILREDLEIDIKGIIGESFPSIDENGTDWRKTYFFRSYIKTMMEIHGVVYELRKNKEFHEALLKLSDEGKKEFQRQLSALDSAHKILKEYRNSVGGHVLQKSIHNALKSTSYDDFGLIEAKDNGEYHLKFVTELIYCALFGSCTKAKFKKVKKIIEQLATIPPLLSINHMINTYIQIKGVLKH